MVTELQLRFNADTGNSTTTQLVEDDDCFVPTSDYMEWLEELALKQIKSEATNKAAEKVVAKLADIKANFDALQSEIGCIDEDEVISGYEVTQLLRSCDTLSDSIYD